ncbi:MAG TPA: MutS family DNA mismatch repair protein [Anaerolineaceae bacterium]|nr:MutS family DNA mismatch repair protein [Anaerolineaceae bacterium]
MGVNLFSSGSYRKARLERCDRLLAELSRIERRYPWARLAAFLAWFLGTIAAFEAGPAWSGWVVLGVGGLVFLILVASHRRVIASQERFRSLRQLIAAQLARVELDWDRIPPSPPLAPARDHPFEADLNLSGERSLHRLVDSAASRGGSQRLLDWLRERSPRLEEIRRRQDLVRSLEGKTGFRERLAMAGAGATGLSSGQRWEGEHLLAWLERSPLDRSVLPLLLLLSTLALVNLALFVASLLGLLPPFWIAGVLLYWGLQSLKYREASELFGEACTLAGSLRQFRAVLVELETYPYPTGDPLAALCAPFWQGEQRPSRSLRSIGLIVSAASLRSNPFLGLFLNTLVPWDLFFTVQLERYKQELRQLLPRWLDTWYEVEALSSLATCGRDHPASVYPELLAEGSSGPVFAARSIGHPLIPASQRVCNDFTIQRLGQIAIITGSNMSGKSTFLRTLGVNLCLAYAGGRVCAAALQTLPFRIFTSIQINDSLNDGISFFYAEVKRLKALLDALDDPAAKNPLFFLIDEIFRGTNNQERRIGSQSYTRALAGKRGTGLISTHDLELVHLAESIPGLDNFHFREDIRDGQMIFEYRLRPGPSPTTNALKIMALEGLPVEAERPTEE